MATSSLQAIRGMNDVLPADTGVWRYIEQSLGDILLAYGYREIRTPVVEKTELFKRSIGEVTDIVEKEMYTFDDRNGDNLALRPEGTASCVRAVLQSGLINQGVQRLWYAGAMFRRERPQKGRYRQFHQIGSEVFGLSGPDIDAEMIMMTNRFWQKLGIENVRLHINSLGNLESRSRYREALVTYLERHIGKLDNDSRRRLHTNPLRILDSKHPDVRVVVESAPCLTEYLDESSRQHFQGLCDRLDAVGISYVLDDKLVRGLDYYSDTVFEWTTDSLGAQGTVCAGGRYDGLVSQLGGQPMPAVGFALGIERLTEMLPDIQAERSPHIYFVGVGDAVQVALYRLSERLRSDIPGLRMIVNCGGGSFKSQFKKADKSGATVALVLGERELHEHNIVVKFLRRDAPQEMVSYDQLAGRMTEILNIRERPKVVASDAEVCNNRQASV